MSERNTATKGTRRSSKPAASSAGFTDDERAAMKDHARELKSAARRDPATAAAEAENEVLAKIAEMRDDDRVIAERLHTLIKAAAPNLAPRTWYGMPAYAKDGSVVCFFQSAQRFKSRFATLGFSDKANLDDGTMWPIYYALQELTPANEEKITALVKQAAS